MQHPFRLALRPFFLACLLLLVPPPVELSCDGGAESVHHLFLDNLIDELIISVIPILLGEGIRLFGQNFPERKLHLVKCTSFEKGLVQLHYSRI